METITGKDKVQDVCNDFVKVLLANNTKGIIKMLTADCEWNIMATGEQFIAIEKIRGMVEHWVTTRYQVPDTQTQLSNKFSGQDQFCVQYVHSAMVTHHWPSSDEKLAIGTMAAINICIICHVDNNGMISRADEYFDLGQLILWGPERELYS